MDSTALQMLLLLMALWTPSVSEPVEPPGPERVDCKDPNNHRFLIEGESLWYVPEDVDGPVTWFWNRSGAVVQLASEEAEPVHVHGDALCLLNATEGRSGCFLARAEDSKGEFVRVSVVPEDSPDRMYSMNESDTNIFILCPGHARSTCDHTEGTISWYKDGALLPGLHEDSLLVRDTSAKDEGRYDCVCTWTHQRHLYRTVGSRVLHLEAQKAYLKIQILAPTEPLQLAHPGARLLLNCTVLCGTNVPARHCVALWKAEYSNLTSDGYSQTKHVDQNPSNRTIVTRTLSIARVSEQHFQELFTCRGFGRYGDRASESVRLRRPQSVVSLVAAGTSVFVLFVLGAAMLKCFVVDLVLLSRRLFPARLKDTEGKVFDAYVVYQMPSQDTPTEELVGGFVFQDLPRVLEDTCGYRLFIHGRDDLPGEDQVELVEERMRKSRRLMVILTPDVGSEVAGSEVVGSKVAGSEMAQMSERAQGYDWQVGLHQALVLTDLSVILIQLGAPGPGGYSHLPPALQHLIQRSAPLRWSPGPRAARARSRFWKRVRFLMPATPVRTCPRSPV